MNKTELVIFRSPKKLIYKNLNFRLSGQKIEPKHHTKYLGVILDEHLSFNEHMNTLKQKLNRTNGILAKQDTTYQLTLSKQFIMHSLTHI